jgi:hypothetical protein
MTALPLAATPRITELLNIVMRLTITERLLLARLLLDSVLTKEIDEEADWHNLSLSAFEAEWDNEEDAIYDNWRQLYGIPAR